jgi:hypothetical protein
MLTFIIVGYISITYNFGSVDVGTTTPPIYITLSVPTIYGLTITPFATGIFFLFSLLLSSFLTVI